MASVRQLLFGQPPFRYLADHLAKDEDFLDDSKFLLHIDEQDFTAFAARCSREDGFLPPAKIRALAIGVLGEGERATRLAKIVWRFGGILHDADMPAATAMQALARAIENKMTELSVEERQTLVRRLRILIVEPAALARQFKARRLESATGADLDKAQIICDMRPVFDDKRERIEGAIPTAILRVEYTTASQDSCVLEVRVSAKQIEAIEKMASTATMKLRVLQAHLVDQGLAMPEPDTDDAEDN